MRCGMRCGMLSDAIIQAMIIQHATCFFSEEKLNIGFSMNLWHVACLNVIVACLVVYSYMYQHIFDAVFQGCTIIIILLSVTTVFSCLDLHHKIYLQSRMKAFLFF